MYIKTFLMNFQNEENIEEWLELPSFDFSENEIAINYAILCSTVTKL